jgi:transcriptional regulator with XRE-family HTH domain
VLLGEDTLGDVHCSHAFGPAGVERDVGDRFNEFVLGQSVLHASSQVKRELIHIPTRREHGYGDEAAVTRGELGAVPDVLEKNVVGQRGELGREVAEGAASTADLLRVLVGVGHDADPFLDDIHPTTFLPRAGGTGYARTPSACYAPEGRPIVAVMDNSNEVREFLTSRRARLSPEDVGLPDFGGRRRVKGLRREEVAMLTGVSTEYYARLERGQIGGVSEQVLDALSGVLKLDDAEREYLANLSHAAQATSRARKPKPTSQAVRPGILAALRAITGAPAFVRNGAMDILAVNELGRAFYSPLYMKSTNTVPNLARFNIFDPAAQSFYPDWMAAVDGTVAVLRQEAGRDPYNKRITEVIGELSTRSEVFRDRWANAVTMPSRRSPTTRLSVTSPSSSWEQRSSLSLACH